MAERSDTTRPLTLDAARKAAKRLKRALGDPSHPDHADASARFSGAFGARKTPTDATHADALHVVAREAGAESWPRLKLAVETAALDRAGRERRLTRALDDGAFWLADRLMALDPSLAEAHLGLRLARADEDGARAVMSAEPEAAIREIAGRPPLAHLCFSQIHRRDPEVSARQIRLLDALLALGADINLGPLAEPGAEHRLSPLYGALGHAGNLALAEALLERGASTEDNESLYHATELPTLEGVRLLFRHGAAVGTTNAFLRMLDRESPEGVRLFLSHGADPNAPPYRHPDGEPAEARNALHHAILRGRSAEIGALLLDAGADATTPYDGKSAYALARVVGNRSMAELLSDRGLAAPLRPGEAFLAAAAEGDAEAATQAAADARDVLATLTPADLARQTELATDAQALPMLKLLARFGVDPNLRGESGMPPIHAAAWHGHADTVRFYASLGVDLLQENMFGGDALGTAIHGSSHCPARAEGDYLGSVQALLDAGAPILPARGHLEMGDESVTAMLEEVLAGEAKPPH